MIGPKVSKCGQKANKRCRHCLAPPADSNYEEVFSAALGEPNKYDFMYNFLSRRQNDIFD